MLILLFINCKKQNHTFTFVNQLTHYCLALKIKMHLKSKLLMLRTKQTFSNLLLLCQLTCYFLSSMSLCRTKRFDIRQFTNNSVLALLLQSLNNDSKKGIINFDSISFVIGRKMNVVQNPHSPHIHLNFKARKCLTQKLKSIKIIRGQTIN